jgi:hypothetical protein
MNESFSNAGLVVCAACAPFVADALHARVLLRRCALSSLEDAENANAVAALLELALLRAAGAIGLETADRLVELCFVNDLKLGLLERLSCCSDGRDAIRQKVELLDALARRLEQQREEAVFRLLVNVSNESMETAVRLCRTQDVLLAVTRVLQDMSEARFDLTLLALALAINCCELSSKARQLARLVGLLPVVVSVFEHASREQLEGFAEERG